MTPFSAVGESMVKRREAQRFVFWRARDDPDVTCDSSRFLIRAGAIQSKAACCLAQSVVVVCLSDGHRPGWEVNGCGGIGAPPKGVCDSEGRATCGVGEERPKISSVNVVGHMGIGGRIGLNVCSISRGALNLDGSVKCSE